MDAIIAQQKEVIKNYVSSYNSFDIEGMTKDLSEAIVFENVSEGVVNLRTEGVASFKEQAEKAKGIFEERQQTITSWAHSGEKVITGIAYKGKLAIDLPNGMKKGAIIELSGTSEFEIRAGKIIKIIDSA